jgi:hypothetical protein
VHKVSDSVSIVHPAVMVIGLQSLTGAVGFLRGHTAILAVQGRARVATLFATPSSGQRAVAPVLDIHYPRMSRVQQLSGKSGWGFGTCHFPHLKTSKTKPKSVTLSSFAFNSDPCSALEEDMKRLNFFCKSLIRT